MAAAEGVDVMDDREKFRRRAWDKLNPRFLTPGTVVGGVASIFIFLLAAFLHESSRAGWLLWVMGISAVAVLLVFAFALARWWGGESAVQPHLFRRARNDDYIAGPPMAVATSLVPSIALVAYGDWALVVGEAWVLAPAWPFVEWWEGLACRAYGAACATTGAASIVRFHTQWRRAHLAFGILVVVAFLAAFLAIAIWDST